MTTTEHLLVCLSEECAEVQKAVSKALRFGLYDQGPSELLKNRELIAHELNDLRAVWLMLISSYDIPCTANESDAIEAKRQKVLKYLHYAADKGTITKPLP